MIYVLYFVCIYFLYFGYCESLSEPGVSCLATMSFCIYAVSLLRNE